MSLSDKEDDDFVPESNKPRVTEQFFHQETEEEKMHKLSTLISKAAQYSNFLATQQTVDREPYYKPGSHPSLLKGGSLRDYQLDGLNWLISLFDNGVNGILADEMGLGKTIITISFLAHLWELHLTGPFLVVAPATTLRNWYKEFEKWAPAIPRIYYHASPAERLELQQEFENFSAPPAKGKKKKKKSKVSQNEAMIRPVVITSFELIMRDQAFFQRHEWRFVVVDEAHRLKNMNCKLLKDLKGVKTLNRLLLTGTPLQNNLTELWSLLNFTLPDVFNSLDNFQQWFDFDVLPEDEEKLANADNDKPSGNSGPVKLQTQADIVEKLHFILRPFFLRRLKSEVNIELPKKREIIVYCPFTAVQKAYYEHVIALTISSQKMTKQAPQLSASVAQALADLPKYMCADRKLRLSLSNVFMVLRKICNHPFLNDAHFDNFKQIFDGKKKPDPMPSEELEPKRRQKQKNIDYTVFEDDKLFEDQIKAFESGKTQIEYQSLEEGDFVGNAQSQKKKQSVEAEYHAQLDALKRPRSAWTLFSQWFFESQRKGSSSGGKVNGRQNVTDNHGQDDDGGNEDVSSDRSGDVVTKKRRSPTPQLGASAPSKRPKAVDADAIVEVIESNDDEQSNNLTPINHQSKSGQSANKENDNRNEEGADTKTPRQRKTASKTGTKRTLETDAVEILSSEEEPSKINEDDDDDDGSDSKSYDDDWLMEVSSSNHHSGAQMRLAAEQWRNLSEHDKLVWQQRSEQEKHYVKEMIESSGKLELLAKMLEGLCGKKDHKVLIFSQMTRMLDIIEDYLDCTNLNYFRLDGSTHHQRRHELIEQFQEQEGSCVFLLSTRAGGLGINLTAADTVIIYDSDWNPQADLQAQDRAHRYGQRKPVVIFRLVTSRSAESRMIERVTEKLRLEKLVIQKGQFQKRANDNHRISSEDIDEVLTLGVGDEVIGKHLPITDEELRFLLDREQLCQKYDLWDRHKNAKAQSSASSPAKAPAPAASSAVKSNVKPPDSSQSSLQEQLVDQEGGVGYGFVEEHVAMF